MSPMQGSKVGGDTCRIVEEEQSDRDWTAACAYVMRAMLGKRMHLLSVKKRDSGEEGTMPFEWRAGREVTLECQWYRM
jgi:hypothetical protein